MCKTAMILSAGFGKRLQPITDKTPKPLVKVHGKAMIDWCIDHVKAAGVEHVIINTHYQAGQIESHFEKRQDPAIHLVHEKEILETGGGIKNAIKTFPNLFSKPFFAINSDSLWLNGPRQALERMRTFWNPSVMDILLLLHPTIGETDPVSAGDFFLNQDNTLTRRGEQVVSPYMYMGASILKPEVFTATDDTHFSMNPLYDIAAKNSRLHGLVHDGNWYHVGTVKDLETAERQLKNALA